MIPPHEIAERALEAASGLDGAVAIVHATSRADVRWARTTLTTNGESRQTDLTLVGFRRSGDGIAAATLSRSQPGAGDISALVERLTASLATAPAAEDAFDLVEPSAGVDAAWGDLPALTSSASLDPLTSALGAMFASCVSSEIELFGYAEHELTTTW
ncbi:MAG: TldD/PmbA family protein, partial [Actinomycetota bacterium]